MAKDLAAWAKKNGVKYFAISFTDLFGAQRAKLVPAAAIADMQVEGAGFAGFASYLDMTPAYPDMLAVPDPESVIQLPWKPEVAWVAGDCVMEGQPVEQAPFCLANNLVFFNFSSAEATSAFFNSTCATSSAKRPFSSLFENEDCLLLSNSF